MDVITKVEISAHAPVKNPRDTCMSKLKGAVYMGPFSDAGTQTFLIAFEHRNWKVAEILYDVAKQLNQEGCSLVSVRAALLTKYPDLTTVQIAKMYQDFFVENGLIEGHDTQKPASRQQGKMLFLKIQLLSQQVLQRLKFLSLLFSKICAVYAGMFVSFGAGYAFYHHHMVNQTFSAQTSYFTALLICILSTFVHEMGHVAASMRFGITPKGVGFAFYWAQPVFYTDVTETWRLRRRERFIIDIAGMCAQGVFIMALLCVGITLQKGTLMLAAVLGWFAILENLNPFLKMDGYWMMTDGLGVSNLHQEAFNRVRYWWLKIRRQVAVSSYTGAKTALFLDAYLIASTFYMVILIKSMAFALPNLFRAWLEQGKQSTQLLTKSPQLLGWAQSLAVTLLDFCTLTVMLILLGTVCWKLILTASQLILWGFKKIKEAVG